MRLRLGVALILALSCTPCLAQQTDYVLFSDAKSEKAHAFASSGSTVQKCGGPVGLRQEYYQCRVTPVIVEEPKNLALNIAQTGYPKPSASSTSVQYDVWSPIDGGDPSWCNEATDAHFSTWDLDFGKPVDVDKIVLTTWKSYALTDFDLYAWNSKLNDWEAGPFVQVTSNKDPIVTFSRLRLKTRKLRVYCLNGPPHQAMYRRIQEFEVYAPPPAHNPRFNPKWMSCRLKVPRSGKWTLEVQEVNEDKHNGDRTRYDILVDGKPVYKRDFTDDGPGLMTYFVDVPASGKSRSQIKFRDTSGFGMRIRSVRAYSNFEAYCRKSGFTEPMALTVRAIRFDPKTGLDMGLINRWLDVFTKAGAADRFGFVADFAYLQKSPEATKQFADALGKLATEKKAKLVFGFPTTWAYSPMNTPDGAGKTFAAIEYQQIAYSKLDTYDDPGLKEYMDSCKPGWYDVHYGLTTPNHWSSTPWFTMNNPRLNAARCKGIADCFSSINPWLAEMEREGISGNLIGLIGEDEPVYWTKIVDVLGDGYGRVNNGVARTDMLVDFNWGVIQDAAKDGVKLDPSDGLDMTEKWWLHRNLAHFNEMLAGAIRGGMRKEAIKVSGSVLTFPKRDRGSNQFVYWTGGQGYPLNDKYHPLWESSVFAGEGIGLGGGPEPYLRARELGSPAASDIESENRTDTTTWIPMLRALYENGCEFTHHTNPGQPENWEPVARFLAHPTPEMDRKRMESLLIIRRRQAQNLIEELRIYRYADAPRHPEPDSRGRQWIPENPRESGSIRTKLITQAERLIDSGDYQAAFEAAIKAKSISLPATYQVQGKGELWPYPIRVDGAGEVTVLAAGKSFRLRTNSTRPMTISTNKGAASAHVPAGTHELTLPPPSENPGFVVRQLDVPLD